MKWTIFLLILTTFQLSGQNAISLLKSTSRKASFTRINNKALISVPMEISRGLIFVEATLNGQKGDFMLDTGAPVMVVNKKPDQLKGRNVRSFSSSFSVEEVTVKAFELATSKWEDKDALAVDISHLERASNRKILGMIGYNTLKEFEVLLDYQHNQLVLLPPIKKNLIHRTAKPKFTIPFEIQDHLPVIKVKLGNKVLKLGLDTGAGANLIDDDFLAHLPQESSQRLKDEEVQGIDGRIEKVQARQISQIAIKGDSIASMKYLFPDLSHLSSTTDLRIDGLLGSPFFRNLKFSINYKTRKIHIWEVYKDASGK